MPKLSKVQGTVILGTIILFVLLFFANRKAPTKVEESHSASSKKEASLSKFIKAAINELPADDKLLMERLTSGLESSKNSEITGFLDSIIYVMDKAERPDISGYFAREKALLEPNVKNWSSMGDRLYSATRIVKQEQQSLFYKEAVAAYKKVLELDTGNVEAMISLGSCYVEGTPQPMAGIGLLKKALAKEPNNVNALLKLGFFSVKSGQYEKAIERFNSVLKIQPEYTEVYLYLAEAYEKTGNNNDAIISLKSFMSSTEDESIKKEIQTYINKLTN